MLYDFSITKNESNYLRELVKKYLAYANLPVMEERKKLWYTPNSLKGSKPVIVMEHSLFEEEMLPLPKCISKAAIEIERFLLSSIINYKFD